MVGENVQIYDVHISPKLKVGLFTTPGQNSLPGTYNHLLGREK